MMMEMETVEEEEEETTSSEVEEGIGSSMPSSAEDTAQTRGPRTSSAAAMFLKLPSGRRLYSNVPTKNDSHDSDDTHDGSGSSSCVSHHSQVSVDGIAPTESELSGGGRSTDMMLHSDDRNNNSNNNPTTVNRMFWLSISMTALAAIVSVAFIAGRSYSNGGAGSRSTSISTTMVDTVGSGMIGEFVEKNQEDTANEIGEQDGPVQIISDKDAATDSSPDLSQSKIESVMKKKINANNHNNNQNGNGGVNINKKNNNANNNKPWPPLDSLLREDDMEIIGDVQFLLDFALVGHSKTATTAQMRWLVQHEEVQMYNHEIHSLKNSKPGELVDLLYALPEGREYKRGYKSPSDIVRANSMESIRTYWPETKLIVGVRHPVKWFESYYNFNTRQGHKLPPAEKMIGKKLSNKPKYHEHLAMLGKTKLVSKDEYSLLGIDRIVTPPVMNNKVFLYDVSQPFDKNQTRLQQYCQDISDFIGLNIPLEPIKPRKNHGGNYHYAIDICDDKFIELRKELMDVGVNASIWMSDYFVDHPDVTVSSPEHFKNDILASWLKDPCDES